MKGRTWIAMAGVAVLATTAFSQSISVNVNGEAVRFAGVGPQSVNGRVLVPLRGVMEKLGAYVGFDSATRTVTATRGDIDLTLRIGERVAVVNGRQVTLDVPAQIHRGSTMVPLRFMGEALGAEVRWDALAQAVNITTETGAAQPFDPNTYTPPKRDPVQPRTVEILTFESTARGILRAGNRVDFTVTGSPGAEATLMLPGVTQPISMREVSPGRYTASYTVTDDPNNPITVSRVSPVARLKIGETERMIQLSNPISIDTQPPTILDVTPAANARVANDRPSITAAFDEGSGSGIDPESVRVYLDRRDITNEATITGRFFSYRPSQPLQAGSHEVLVTAKDEAGNTVNRSWAFTVVGASDVIRSFSHNVTGTAQPGDVVLFTLYGESGGTATFTIGHIAGRPMTETAPGRYVGEYTIRRGDDFRRMPVTAKLRTKSGQTFTAEINQNLQVAAVAPEAPRILTPTADARVGNSVVIRGKADANSRVRIKIDYRTTALGLFQLTGTIADQVVETDANGNFETRPISLDTMGGSGSTTYTLTAVTLGVNDQESEVTKLTFKR